MTFLEDLIVDVYLFKKIEYRGNMYVAKLLYLIEEELYKNDLIGPSYKMYKFPFGPYNTEIPKDLISISKLNLLGLEKIKDNKYGSEDKEFNVYYPIGETNKFLKEIDELISEHSYLFDIIDIYTSRFKNINGEEIRDFIYGLENTGPLNQKMEQYTNNYVLINPYDVRRPEKIFKIDEDWEDTIDIILNPKLQKQLEDALDDVRNNRIIT
jgi:hypothetical protein